jgi:hypothetical protein
MTMPFVKRACGNETFTKLDESQSNPAVIAVRLGRDSVNKAVELNMLNVPTLVKLDISTDDNAELFCIATVFIETNVGSEIVIKFGLSWMSNLSMVTRLPKEMVLSSGLYETIKFFPAGTVLKLGNDTLSKSEQLSKSYPS